MSSETVATKLKALRKEKGESQAQTAEAIGITPAAYAMYETGDRTPRDPVKEKIAEHFNKSIGFIFFDEGTH